MANEKHIYLTVGGGYIAAATPLAAETWQFGVRLPLVFGDVDMIATLPSNWSPYADPQNHTETDWTTASNWSVEGPGAVTWNPCDYLTDNVMPAARTLINTSGVFSASVQLRECRVYPIGSTGHAVPAPPYAAGTPAVGTFTGTLPVGAGTGSNPPQVTAAITLRTQQIGRRGRGRCFGPMPVGTPTGTGTTAGIMTSTLQTNMLAAWKQFLEDISVVGLSGGSPSLRPSVIGDPWTNYAAVTTISLDGVFDTQRRRRRSVVAPIANATLDIG